MPTAVPDRPIPTPTAVRRWLTLAGGILLALALLATPGSAQGLSSGPVSCDPADPQPGDETTCTAEELEPSSAFTWEASFADGSAESGSGSADAEGVGELTFTAPEAEGDFTVTVRGTGADGEPYEESHEGTVGGGGLPVELLGEPSEEPDEPSEEPGNDPTDEPTEGGADDDDATAPGGDGGQVNPVPSGAVAAGAGGLADRPDTGLFRGLAVLLVLATATTHVVVRRRLPTVERRGR